MSEESIEVEAAPPVALGFSDAPPPSPDPSRDRKVRLNPPAEKFELFPGTEFTNPVHVMCLEAGVGERRWDDVPKYLKENSHVDAGKEDLDWTPLYLAIWLHAPVNVVQALIDHAPGTVEVKVDGILPVEKAALWYEGPHTKVVLTTLATQIDYFIHITARLLHGKHAMKVLQVLVNADKKALTTENEELQYPLHCAFLNERSFPSPGMVELLLGENNEAAKKPDWQKKLPIHYLAEQIMRMKPANETTLQSAKRCLDVLLNAYPECMSRTWWTPFKNCIEDFVVGEYVDGEFVVGHRKGRGIIALSSDAAKFAECNSRSCADRSGNTPVHNFVLAGAMISSVLENENVREQNLGHFYEEIMVKGMAPAMLRLPSHAKIQLYKMRATREFSNFFMMQSLPLAVLFHDLYVLVLLIVSFRVACHESLESPDTEWGNQSSTENQSTMEDSSAGSSIDTALTGLWIGCCALVIREMLQVVAYLDQGMFGRWLFDLWNVADMILIALLVISTGFIQRGTGMDESSFKALAATTTGVLWLNVVSFLKTVRVDFSVFVSGLMNVAWNLTSFLVMLVITMLAFSQMFFTAFQGDEEAVNYESFETAKESLFTVYRIVLGNFEVDPTQENGDRNTLALVLFSIFGFLVVIILLNVLIAIVTDSYTEVEKEKAETAFWSNRMSFVAEIGAIGSLIRCDSSSIAKPMDRFEQWKSRWWKFVTYFYREQTTQADSWALWFLRFVFFFVILIWLVLGLFFGLLWPRQVKRFILDQRDERFAQRADEDDTSGDVGGPKHDEYASYYA